MSFTVTVYTGYAHNASTVTEWDWSEDDHGRFQSFYDLVPSDEVKLDGLPVIVDLGHEPTTPAPTFEVVLEAARLLVKSLDNIMKLTAPSNHMPVFMVTAVAADSFVGTAWNNFTNTMNGLEV